MSDRIQLGQALATIGQASTRPDFELRFNQLQNTVIRRVNAEIEKITAGAAKNTRVVKRLQKEHDKLSAELPALRTFLFGNEANRNRLIELSLVVTEATDTFSSVDDDTNLTADEADAINVLKNDIIDRLQGLYVIKHPGVKDANIIEKLRDLVADLEGLTAVAGAVDAAGSGSPSNGNRALLDTLAVAQNRVDVGVEVTDNTAGLTNALILNYQKKILELEAKFTEITAADAKRQAAEIADLKTRNAHLLQAISISFEATSSLGDFLLQNLGTRRPAPGSVLNLFV